jgi:hypothetical protein
VGLDRAHGYVQLGGGLGGRPARNQESQDFQLALAEGIVERSGRSGRF